MSSGRAKASSGPRAGVPRQSTRSEQNSSEHEGAEKQERASAQARIVPVSWATLVAHVCSVRKYFELYAYDLSTLLYVCCTLMENIFKMVINL